ncbi:Co/Zn/Cd efflux system component [Microcella putealis]|uniref:Co/Zn/Cd efflux system component n=1 Tax=Microcella putealis TaxID=337005 RepID=A0A4Q7LIA1_9MICO|nr:cation diffusion facilitator family transporter [Microcella putealis]RZS53477.1 Co/Zn/Cd efflux system component [Microcella putealis]TQM26921.1 Co/Zn/Cd efflux system component [Microcella putealis]
MVTSSSDATRAVRRVVLTVAALNAAYFVVELVVALAISSVSLLADSVDFFEDAAINLLIAVALGWSLLARARLGRLLAIVIVVPSVVALVQAVTKALEPEAPAALPLIIAASGGALVNVLCAVLLARHRRVGGSLVSAAWLVARNDVVINVAIVAMGLITLLVVSGWPDLILGVLILALNASAAAHIWRAAHDETLAARASRAAHPAPENRS